MSKKQKNGLLDKTAYYLLAAIFKLTRVVPLYMTHWLGSGLGRLFWFVTKLRKERHAVTIGNLRNLFPDAPEEKLERIGAEHARHWGREFAEFFRTPLLTRASLDTNVRFEGFEHFREAFSKDKGVILVTAHFGNFEAGISALALCGYPMCSVIRTADNPGVDKLMTDLRESVGTHVIKRENAAREIIKRLRAGEVVTIPFDQNAAFNNIYVPFFGKWAATFTTPAVLGLRTDAAIVPMFAFRPRGSSKYIVRFYPEITGATGDKSADIRLITTKLNQTLEQVIREAPEQWLWVHRRWKTQPDEKEMETIVKQQETVNAALNDTGAGAAA